MRPENIRSGTRVKIAVDNPVGGQRALQKGDTGTAIGTPDAHGAFRAKFDGKGGNFTILAHQVSPA